jgi:pimeloyl-ACP methyl ester carboxylesterase
VTFHRIAAVVLATAAGLHSLSAVAQSTSASTKPCRISGFKSEMRCGVVQRPLNPSNPGAGTIDVHFVVVPATARNKKNDALFFFAGGPGQSAIKVSSQVFQTFARLSDWRDIVFIDQRGTGKSAPLTCKAEQQRLTLQEMFDVGQSVGRLKACMTEMGSTPHGKALDQFSTEIAMQDVEAVRAALGYEKINLAGASYGTRAALEYARQFPQRVRRMVIDGVAPPDMVLPETAGQDAAASLEQMFAGCEAEARCKAAYPNLRAQWQTLVTQGVQGKATHPLNGREESITINAEMLEGIVRGPLYAPTLSAVLPFAISEAAQGRINPLLGAGIALSAGIGDNMSWGMHFSVICSEDFPRMKTSTPATNAFERNYRELCPNWPKANVSPGFFQIPAAPFPALVMSGGVDPVTPTRHGERLTKALGANAKHVVVPQAGHGVMNIGCMRDVMFKFINVPTDAAALEIDAACVTGIPRPTAWVMPGVTK